MDKQIRLKIEEHRLTDGSSTYNVAIYSTDQIKAVIRLHACSQQDAWWLVEKINAAIGEHTVDYASAR